MQTMELKEKTMERKWLFLIVFFLFTSICILFSVLCIYGTANAFFTANKGWITALSVAILCFLCGIGVFFCLKGKETLVKSLLSIYIFVAFCLILIYIFQKTGFFAMVRTPSELQTYIEKSGAWMPILYILLQYLQVVILPIPSVVSTVAGVALFGPLKTAIYSLIGIVFGSFTAFFIGRKLGNKAVSWIIGEETLVKWQKKLKGKDSLFLTVMFLLPVFPDDILCFIAGLSSMSSAYFIVMILISRLLAIFATCYSVEFIPLNTWWGAVLWGLFILGIVAIFIVVYKNMDKIQAKIQERKKRRQNDRE